jgi:hypothetical protein
MKQLGFKHALILSLMLFAASAELFYYRAFVAPRAAAAAELQTLTTTLSSQTQSAPVAAAADDKSSATIPDLLARVQELALESGVSVVAIEPQANTNTQFRITLDATYAGMVRFLTRFEGLQITVAGFEMLRMPETGTLRLVMDFSHTTTPSPVRPRVIAEFEAKVRSENLSDPFEPESGALVFFPERDPNDLTWTFHLTSISEIDDRRTATIDGVEYEQGDQLAGREISAIGEDTVTLKEPVDGGERRLFLRFRDAPPSDRT